VLGRGFFSVFFGCGVSVVCADVLGFELVVAQSQGWLSGGTFVGGFVLFGQAFGLEVAVGFLEGAEDGDVVGVVLLPPSVVLLLIRLQLHRIFLLPRLLLSWLMPRLQLHLFPEDVLHRDLYVVNRCLLAQLDVDRRSV
jgi:hypothetical protein